jgi:hypothetical protein
MNPRARKAGLVVRKLEDELLVYDLERHRAHCLNRAAAIVFRGCDGRTGVPELAARLRRELGAGADARWVRLAIGRLSKAGLLEDDGVTPVKDGRRPSRRELMRRAGQVAGLTLLLPTVTSLLAPTPAEAAATCVTNCSGQAFGTPCRNSNPSDCGIVCICNGSGGCVLVSDGITPCP